MSTEDIRDIERSVNRLRSERALIERLHMSVQEQEIQVTGLKRKETALKNKVKEVTLDSLTQEKRFRETMVRLEEEITRARDSEESAKKEIRSLRNELRAKEASIRGDVAGVVADEEEKRYKLEKALEQSRETVLNLTNKLRDCDDSSHSLQSQRDRHMAEIETIKKRNTHQISLLQHEISSMKGKHDLARQEVAGLKEKVNDLQVLNSRQDRLLREKDIELADSQHGELLLQKTVEEMQQNMVLVREQAETIEKKLRHMEQKQIDTESRAERAEKALADLQVADDIKRIVALNAQELAKKNACNECAQLTERHRDYKTRMDKQLQTLTQKLKALQYQLVQEMKANETLQHTLEKERAIRKKTSLERFQLLTEFYNEEHKLHETLRGLNVNGSPGLLSVSGDDEYDDQRENIVKTNNPATAPPPRKLGVAVKTTAASRARSLEKRPLHSTT